MRSSAALLLLWACLLLHGTDGKKRSGTSSKHVSSRKRECEHNECAAIHADDRENCILRCQSAACYEQVYASEELEPGEVDTKRSREFTQCINAEARRTRRTGGAVPPSPPVADAKTAEGDVASQNQGEL